MDLRTDRLQLRDFREDDWPAVLAYQSNPLSLRYYAWAECTPEAVKKGDDGTSGNQIFE